MAKVRKDSHGVYILTGGYCFRPKFPVGYNHAFSDGTQFEEGQDVKSRHKGGTPLATVKAGDKDEVWFCFGPYRRNGKMISSEELDKPEF